MGNNLQISLFLLYLSCSCNSHCLNYGNDLFLCFIVVKSCSCLESVPRLEIYYCLCSPTTGDNSLPKCDMGLLSPILKFCSCMTSHENTAWIFDFPGSVILFSWQVLSQMWHGSVSFILPLWTCFVRVFFSNLHMQDAYIYVVQLFSKSCTLVSTSALWKLVSALVFSQM